MREQTSSTSSAFVSCQEYTCKRQSCKRQSLIKGSNCHYYLGGLIDPAFRFPAIEEWPEEHARFSEFRAWRADRVGGGEDEKIQLAEGRIHYGDLGGVGHDGSVCPEFGANRAQR